MSSSAASDDADVARLTTIPVICGATASGKSVIAMWLAQRHPITILSADSRQVYRHFNIGTAKPTAEERARVPHVGIDVVEPTQRFSAAHWSDLARAAIADALAVGRIPLVVGGTGFYIRSLFEPLWSQPALDESHRRRLQRAIESLSTDELRRWAAALDPDRAHLGRAQLLRCVEVALLTGRRLSDLHVERDRPAQYRPSYLLVDPGSELHGRIVARATAMLDDGWIEEVDALTRVVPDSAPAWNATGYDVVRRLVRGELDRSDALERVVIDTRQYAKRQRTWFRHQLDPDRVHRVAWGASGGGWQEVAERWMTTIEGAMRRELEGAR